MERPIPDDTLRTRVSLINRVKNLADDRSWTEFFARYQRIVQSVARSRGLSEHEAEDVMQEVFMRVAETIGKFSLAPRPGSFRSWLFQLTRWRADVDDVWESYQMEPQEFFDGDEVVVVTARERGRGRGSGVEVDRPVTFLCRLRSGRVSEIRSYDDSGRALRDAGLEG